MGILEVKPWIKPVVPNLFEGMDNSVSRKPMVANVLSLQPLLYAKLLGSCKSTTVSGGGGGGGIGGGVR
jgi:uncharacterized membrane protein